MSQNAVPRILWGASFANVLSFGYPLDGPISYPLPREGSEWVQASSGVRDAWLVGTDQRLRGSVRHIPIADTVSPVASGWDGATGWRAFLEWARAMNVFRFYPDKDLAGYLECYLVAPLLEPPALEDDGTRTLELEVESSAGTAFSGY